MKICSKCKVSQQLSEFHKSSVHKDGLNPQCRTCFNNKRLEFNNNNKDIINERAKDWYKRNKNHVRTTQMLAKYNLTSEQYNLMVKNQNECCAICNTKMIGPREPAIDHCHNTGQVRGLLCSSCNIALGHMKDDINRLENAIAYLKKTKKIKLVG